MASKFAKERTDNRMKDYKSAFSAEDHRKRREESIVSIRRQRREENILKKRNMDIIDEEETQSPNGILLSNLPLYIDMIKDSDIQKQIEGTIGIRKLLSIEINPPINNVIEIGAVPILINFLSKEESPKLQFEASWALTNIASGTTQQTLILLQQGAVNAFVNQLQANDVGVREQAVWALGNIAGDSYQFRDHVLSHNVLQRLFPLTSAENKPSLRRNAVWTISNLCRGKPAPNFAIVSCAIPHLANLLNCSDNQIITDACWALSYLSDGDNLKIQAIIDVGICRTVVSYLSHKSQAVQTPALRIIGNIVTGDDFQTQTAIECGALPILKQMLDNPNLKKAVKKEVCWTISNITAGQPPQIQYVIDAKIFDSLIYHIHHSDFEVKKEAAWAIANATSSATPSQVFTLVQSGCIRALCELLTSADTKVVAVSLEGLENILEKGEEERERTGVNPFADQIEDDEGIPKIENLQSHSNQGVYDRASAIIEKYFSNGSETDDDGEDDIAPVANNDAGSFTFGAPSLPSNFNFK